MNDYYIGQNDIAETGNTPYFGQNNVAGNIVKAYVGVGNAKARLWYMQKPDMPLYWLGDECTDNTGGWSVLSMPTSERTNLNQTYTASTPIKYTHKQHFYDNLIDSPKVTEIYTQIPTNAGGRTSGGMKTVNKIDLTGYEYINLICDLWYTDGKDGYVNKWNLVGFGDNVSDYGNIPINEVVFQNPTNDHWISTYDQYTGPDKFLRVQKIAIPSNINQPLYIGLKLLHNAAMISNLAWALKAMWLT